MRNLLDGLFYLVQHRRPVAASATPSGLSALTHRVRLYHATLLRRRRMREHPAATLWSCCARALGGGESHRSHYRHPELEDHRERHPARPGCHQAAEGAQAAHRGGQGMGCCSSSSSMRPILRMPTASSMLLDAPGNHVYLWLRAVFAERSSTSRLATQLVLLSRGSGVDHRASPRGFQRLCRANSPLGGREVIRLVRPMAPSCPKSITEALSRGSSAAMVTLAAFRPTSSTCSSPIKIACEYLLYKALAKWALRT